MNPGTNQVVIVALGSFVVCYILGGQGHKLARKWVGPAILAVSVPVFGLLHHTFTFYLLASPLYFLAANSVSYGVDWTQDIPWKKVLFRAICGALYGLPALFFSLGHNPLIGVLQLILAALLSVFFGVFSPFSRFLSGNLPTMLEDAFIATGYVLLLPWLF